MAQNNPPSRFTPRAGDGSAISATRHTLMKNKALIFVSLGLNVVALGYILWIHQHPDQVVRDREMRVVQKWEPQFRSIYQGFGVKNVMANPTTLDELLQPLSGIVNVITSPQKP